MLSANAKGYSLLSQVLVCSVTAKALGTKTCARMGQKLKITLPSIVRYVLLQQKKILFLYQYYLRLRKYLKYYFDILY